MLVAVPYHPRWDGSNDWNKYTVLFNDIDISKYCRAASDNEGWIDVIEVDAKGCAQIDFTGNLITRKLTGKVQIVPT